jgi:hypothetical protein
LLFNGTGGVQHFFFQSFPYNRSLTRITRVAAATRTIPVNNCSPNHPVESIAPAMGFPKRSPKAHGINNIPNRTPSRPGSGDRATVRFNDKLAIAPEKKPKMAAKRRSSEVVRTVIHINPSTPAIRMQILVMLNTPNSSAMYEGI